MQKSIRARLLAQRICDLNLKIDGSHLGGLISRLYAELERAGISFRPEIYLSDEWGCPHGEALVGIPFYLADKNLCQLEDEFSGVPPETDSETLMYLRHEVGHAFNYAYNLHATARWQRLFGDFRKPYSDQYKTRPFSADYVRHIPGWYAQKHPDEDFAETFAVWLTPDSDWQRRYRGAPALKKLSYVDQVVRRLGRRTPAKIRSVPHLPVKDLTCTLAGWFRGRQGNPGAKLKLPDLIDLDLARLFPARRGRSAARVLRQEKGALVRRINDWTGLERHLLDSLLEGLLQRVGALNLRLPSGGGQDELIDFTAFLTSLAMNYQANGRLA